MLFKRVLSMINVVIVIDNAFGNLRVVMAECAWDQVIAATTNWPRERSSACQCFKLLCVMVARWHRFPPAAALPCGADTGVQGQGTVGETVVVLIIMGKG